jgi:hypothetical protein
LGAYGKPEIFNIANDAPPSSAHPTGWLGQALRAYGKPEIFNSG